MPSQIGLSAQGFKRDFYTALGVPRVECFCGLQRCCIPVACAVLATCDGRRSSVEVRQSRERGRDRFCDHLPHSAILVGRHLLFGDAEGADQLDSAAVRRQLSGEHVEK